MADKKQNIATMSFDELGASLRTRAKKMMSDKNVNGALVFGTLARRFTEAARMIDGYELTEAAVATMIENDEGAAKDWAKKKLEKLTADATEAVEH